MNRIAATALVLLLAACSKATPPAPAASASDAAVEAATGGASDTGDAPAAAGTGPVSRYTQLKQCKLVESGKDEDWSDSSCQGPGGYSLILAYGDARDDLQVIRPGQKPAELGLPYLAGGGFNTLGDTVEWRGTGAGAAFRPTALIVRNSAVQDPERPEHATALLAVIDLARACVIAQIKPGPGQNQQARAVADGAQQPCLKWAGSAE